MQTPIINADDLQALLPWDQLIEALQEAFRVPVEVPDRNFHLLEEGLGAKDASLLVMPSWSRSMGLGVKLLTIFPENIDRGKPSVAATYILFDPESGALRALLDGTMLTLLRTAAASALASRYLSRQDSRKLLIVGTGALAPFMAHAHSHARPITELEIWGRDFEKAKLLADDLGGKAVEDLQEAVKGAHIISCCTSSETPLVMGEDVSPGTHLDLVGSYRAHMAEADEAAVSRARVYVDSFEGALKDAGEIIQALESGALKREEMAGDLIGLCQGEAQGRLGAEEITLFKSVGTAQEDLAAASLAFKRYGERHD